MRRCTGPGSLCVSCCERMGAGGRSLGPRSTKTVSRLDPRHPYAWIFFVPFILVASFTVLNLFLAIIVNSLQHLQQEETEHALETAREIAHDEAAALSRDIAALRREIADLRAGLGHGAPPETRHETGPGERRGG